MEHSNPIAGIFFMGFMLTMFLFVVAMIAATWRIFTKAGQPGWTCLIPVYNWYLMTQIVGLPPWTLLLLFVPLVNIAVGVLVCHRLAQSFGKDIMYTVGMIVPFTSPFFLMMLGFGDAQYRGPGQFSMEDPIGNRF